MIWWAGAMIALVIWWVIGAEVLMCLDRREGRTEGEILDAERRGDRTAFRVFSLIWPITLVLYGCLMVSEYRTEHPGSGRIRAWLQGGGLTHRYIEWRQRR